MINDWTVWKPPSFAFFTSAAKHGKVKQQQLLVLTALYSKSQPHSCFLHLMGLPLQHGPTSQ
jgi:hypothetical protein